MWYIAQDDYLQEQKTFCTKLGKRRYWEMRKYITPTTYIYWYY